MNAKLKKSEGLALAALAVAAIATALFAIFVSANAPWWFYLIIFVIVAGGAHGGFVAQARDSKIIDD